MYCYKPKTGPPLAHMEWLLFKQSLKPNLQSSLTLVLTADNNMYIVDN